MNLVKNQLEIFSKNMILIRTHCAIMDLYDNSIVAYNLSTKNNNPLVIKNLDLAIAKTSGSTPLLHSDRGFQYISNEFNKKIKNIK